MKKILYSAATLMFALCTSVALTSCEDVPEPYNNPNASHGTIADGDEDADGDNTSVAKGSGTLEDPYNAIAANKYIATLPADTESDKDIYVKGKVVSISDAYNSNFGNASFYISEDGTSKNRFYVYRALYLGNQKYKDGQTALKEGDEVIICGKVVNYKGNTPETVQSKAYLYSLNGKTTADGSSTTTGVATGDGTLENPYNAVAANKLGESLADNASSGIVYIKGKVSSVKEAYNSQYGNGTFYISEDGKTENQFYVYRAMYLNNEAYTDGKANVQVGDDVVVCGKITKYVSTYGTTIETVQKEAYLYSLKSNGGGSTGGGDVVIPGGVTFEASSFGFGNGVAVPSVTLSDGTVLTFDNGGGRNTPTYYTAGGGCVRMYPSNTMTIKSSKTIKQIIIGCGSGSKGLGNASGDVKVSNGTIAVDGSNLNITGVNNKEIIVTDASTTTGIASQLYVKTLTFVYAE